MCRTLRPVIWRILLFRRVPVVSRSLLVRLIAIIRLILPRLIPVIWRILLVLLSLWELINPRIRLVLGEG